MPLISMKACSKGAPILFFLVEAMSLIEYQYLFICYEPIKNSPCLIVSLEHPFEEDNQIKWFEGRSEGKIFLCVFFADTHKN